MKAKDSFSFLVCVILFKGIKYLTSISCGLVFCKAQISRCLHRSVSVNIRMLVHIYGAHLLLSLSQKSTVYLISFWRYYLHVLQNTIRHIPHGIRTSINYYSVAAMENFLTSNLFFQCRLCGVGGDHEIDIWDKRTLSVHSDCSDELALNEKIFECIGVQVRRLKA